MSKYGHEELARQVVIVNASTNDEFLPDERVDKSEQKTSPHDEYRTPYQRDRDRLLYSSAFRRLDGVTQVASVRERQLLHNRLTHSLKVGQLGRRMAERLVGLPGFNCEVSAEDFPEIVEVAGLAHDLGHPPFGHIAEGVLDDLMGPGNGGFEGNAQSFRIVSKIAVRNGSPGLNLTRASLNSILKYPVFLEDFPSQWAISWHDRSRGTKWGVYERERDVFQFARGGFEGDIRSSAAIVMDWADDVSYATHDISDYFRANLIPLHAFKSKPSRNALLDFMVGRGKDYDRGQLESAYDRLCAREFPVEPWGDRIEDRKILYALMSSLIDEAANAVQLTANGHPPYLEVDISAQYEVEILKNLTFLHVIEKPPLKVAQSGQRKLIAGIFECLQEEKAAKPVLLTEIENAISDAESRGAAPHASNIERRSRAICDYLCALTEDQAVDLYERLTGLKVSKASIFDVWFN